VFAFALSPSCRRWRTFRRVDATKNRWSMWHFHLDILGIFLPYRNANECMIMLPLYPSRGRPQISQSPLPLGLTNVQCGQTFSPAPTLPAASPGLGESMPIPSNAARGVAPLVEFIPLLPLPFDREEGPDDSAIVRSVSHPPLERSWSSA
jgi:hypothetical protein